MGFFFGVAVIFFCLPMIFCQDFDEDVTSLKICDETFNSTRGSGGTPQKGFPRSSSYSWCVKLANITRLYVSIDEFSLSNEDQLEVYSDSSLLGNFTNLNSPSLIYVQSKNLRLHLKSGASSSTFARRVNFTYTSDSCLKVVKAGEGVLHSPFYVKSTTSPSLKCQYLLKGHEDKRLALFYSNIDLNKGTLEVHDGTTLKDPIIRKFIGGNYGDGDSLSSGQSFLLSMTLSPLHPESTFTIKFASFDSGCSSNISTVQNITSPGYPNSPPYGLRCLWFIRAPPSWTLHLSLNSAVGANFLNIKDGGSFNSPDFTSGLNDIFSSGNTVRVYFTSSESTVGNGSFVLTVQQQRVSRLFYDQGTIDLRQVPHVNVKSPISFQIIVSDNEQVYINVNDSNMLPTSTLSFYDGLLPDSENLIAKFSSDTLFYPVVTVSSKMLVVAEGFGFARNLTRFFFVANFKGISSGSYFSSSESSGVLNLESTSASSQVVWTINSPVHSNGIISLRVNQLSLDVNGSLSVFNGPALLSQRLFHINSSVARIPLLYMPAYPTKRVVYHLNSNSMIGQNNGPMITLLNAQFQRLPVCGGNITEIEASRSLSITSPGFPDSYPLNAWCVYTIYPEVNTSTHLYFSAIDLLPSDYVLINKTTDSTSHLSNQTVRNVTTETVGVFTSSRIPDDLIVTADLITVVFSSRRADASLDVATGFSLGYRSLECGFNTTNHSGTIQTDGYPKPVNDAQSCLWIITLPNAAGLNSSTNVVKFNYLLLKHSNSTKVEFRDGGSSDSPVISLPDVASSPPLELMSRRNKLWIKYKFTSPTNGSLGAAFRFSYELYACPLSQQCHNKVCMQKSWRCNGFDDCGDGTDEEGCTCNPASQQGVSVGVLIGIVVVACIISVLVACVAPVVYRRMKLRKYDRLHDITSSVTA